MRLFAIVAVVATACPSIAWCVTPTELAREICGPNEPGYTLTGTDIAWYNSTAVYGSFSYGGSTQYRLVHPLSSEDRCVEQTSEGMFINVCRSAPVARNGNTLTNTRSWTDWGSCS